VIARTALASIDRGREEQPEGNQQASLESQGRLDAPSLRKDASRVDADFVDNRWHSRFSTLDMLQPDMK